MKEEEEKTEKPDKRKLVSILSGVGRYILGLIILLSPAAMAMLTGTSPMIVVMGIFTPPLTFLVTPPMLIGLYFMLTGKTRVRLDITLLFIALICILAMIGINASNTA